MVDSDLVDVSFGKRRKIAEPTRNACGIDNVETEQRAATTELEVQIPFVGIGLQEEFHATVKVGGCHVSNVDASYELVPHLKESIQAVLIVEQTRLRSRVVFATLRPKIGDLKGIGAFPGSFVPISTQAWPNCSVANCVMHKLLIQNGSRD